MKVLSILCFLKGKNPPLSTGMDAESFRSWKTTGCGVGDKETKFAEIWMCVCLSPHHQTHAAVFGDK